MIKYEKYKYSVSTTYKARMLCRTNKLYVVHVVVQKSVAERELTRLYRIALSSYINNTFEFRLDHGDTKSK